MTVKKDNHNAIGLFRTVEECAGKIPAESVNDGPVSPKNAHKKTLAIKMALIEATFRAEETKQHIFNTGSLGRTTGVGSVGG